MKYLSAIFIFIVSLLTSSCANDELLETVPKSHTLFVVMPYTGGAGSRELTTQLLNNIQMMRRGLKPEDLDNTRLLIAFQYSDRSIRLSEIRPAIDGTVGESRLAVMSDVELTTVDGFKRLFSQLYRYAPADSYSMIVGSHGIGWLYDNTTITTRGGAVMDIEPINYGIVNGKQEVLSRYFGGGRGYRIEIETLRKAMEESGLHTHFLLFDDCYMANVETAYELRQVTDYVVGCPTEIMAYGMPYDRVIRNLLIEENYELLVNEMLDFYRTYEYPYATIGVIRTRELTALADIMKEINSIYQFDSGMLPQLQPMDGYIYDKRGAKGTIFFDLSDYVEHLCTDPVLLASFKEQLDKTVPYKGHTNYYFAAAYSTSGGLPIRKFSGITTSAPSVSPWVVGSYNRTSWYQATH